MPTLSREENERLDRLAGSGRGTGGGLPLPALFGAMLNELLDNNQASSERMAEITASELNFKAKAVFATWPSWEALTADVLAQMEAKGIIGRRDGLWVRGVGLVTGRRLEIIPARPSKGSKSDGVTVWEKDEREARNKAAFAAGDAAELAATLRPENRGLRPVDRGHVQEIQGSVPEVGQLYPILVDQHGRILDGKHRYAADPGWQRKRIEVDSDEMALAIAVWANEGKPLPPKVARRIEDLVLGAKTAQERQRNRIREALLEQAAQNKPLSHRAVAKLLGMENSQRLVGEECQNLMFTHEHYADCPHRFTEDGKEAPGPKPKQPTAVETKVEPVIREHPEWSNNQALAEAGLNRNHHHAAARVRDRLEEEGAIPPAPVREGSDGRPRRVPRDSVPPAPPAQPAEPADGGALSQMVDLFRKLAGPIRRQLVARLLRELSDEDRAEVFSEIGR